MLVKDNFDTHDMVTTGGSIALTNNIPPDDAFMVRRIREEDAIIIAKTNMAEWAFSPRETVSSSFDTTRNAYDSGPGPGGIQRAARRPGSRRASDSSAWEATRATPSVGRRPTWPWWGSAPRWASPAGTG